MTKFKAKLLDQQVIVITGASSGIGLATAKMAASRGAKVVMAARHQEELDQCAHELESMGGNALAVVTDVTDFEDLLNLRDEALSKFGTIDTWINNAGTSIYGYLLDSKMEEERKLFETNFWGTRMGCTVAIEALMKNGGTLINLGSEVSSASQPLLGMYSATKHAIKAFTDALRSELKEKKLPIEVCLVRPTALDTPFPEHATNRLDVGEPSLPRPLYHPDVAAEAILKAAVHPQRDVYVGGPARLSAIIDTFFPHVKDMIAETRMKELKKGTGLPHDQANENLESAPSDDGRKRGHMKGPVFHSSLYTTLTTASWVKNLKDSVKSFKGINHH